MHSDGASRVSNDDVTSNTDSVLTLKGAVQDIAFGSLAGMVSELFEYPFDLAKVRLQSQLLSAGQPTFKGPLDCLVKTWKEEGVRGLYRGLTVPLVGSMAETAAIFLAYNSFQNAIYRYYGQSPSDGNREPLSITQLGLAAAGAGAMGSFIITPIELVKCKLQVQMMSTHTPSRIPIQAVSPKVLAEIASTPTSPFLHAQSKSNPPAPRHPRPHFDPHLIDQEIVKATPHPPKPPPLTTASAPGPVSITRNIIRTNGFRGLWLGHTGTVLRDTGGTAVWFASKEWIGRVLRARRQTSPDDPIPQTLLPWESAVAGALSGAICTVALYPADTVKSAVQTEEELREYRKSGASAAREWSANHGHHHTSTKMAGSGNSGFEGSPLSTSSTKSTSRHHTSGPKATPSSLLRASLSSAIPRSSFIQTFRKIYSTHGLQGLYSGCGMTMARAIPSSGIVFVVYDGLTAWFA
ncbi:mitochondrial ornithine carrier protein [Marasmius tenuissimus]|nr:mitochondrial ornithine carrier protein [Marasmius tenuissimus]